MPYKAITEEIKEKARLRAKEYYLKNKEYIKTRRKLQILNRTEEQKEHHLKKCREYYSKNKELFAETNRRYRRNLSEEKRQEKAIKKKEYRAKSRHLINKQEKEYLQKNITAKLARMIRCRTRTVIKKENRKGSAITALGCSIEDFKLYISKLFTEGMSWENYGIKGWHLDHIIPLSMFDFTKEGEYEKACHYTNLQPLWAKENLSKGGGKRYLKYLEEKSKLKD